jgi:hypothetical protein
MHRVVVKVALRHDERAVGAADGPSPPRVAVAMEDTVLQDRVTLDQIQSPTPHRCCIPHPVIERLHETKSAGHKGSAHIPGERARVCGAV